MNECYENGIYGHLCCIQIGQWFLIGITNNKLLNSYYTHFVYTFILE